MATYYAAPPVPPRPYSPPSNERHASLPPPVPPLPPDFRPVPDDEQLLPHMADPLLAPRPQRLNPDLPADMARTLDEQTSYAGPRLSTPQPPSSINYNPGFIVPGSQPYRGPSTAPPPPMVGDGGLAASMAGLSVGSGAAMLMPMPGEQTANPRRTRALSTAGPPTTQTPSLTATLPTVPSLQSALPAVQLPSADVSSKVAWVRDVLLLVNRASSSASASALPTATELPTGPARINDPGLQRLADAAVPLLLSLAPSIPQTGTTLSPALAEALYLRGTLTASGAFPAYLPSNPRAAFREFEAAARAGYHAAWFRLGRDYEAFGDAVHARECFERGAKSADEGCTYRLGMAHLLGQLALPASPSQALPLLQRAAALASVAVPQPAYVYALLLLDELPSGSVPPALLPAGQTRALEAKRHLERAAFLHFAPAQYKLGHAYEFAEAQCACPFDPLLSVQYYSLASQQGEPEADMALSKWFLCGAQDLAEGGFAKDEGLAFTFAEKAARKGLPSGEFAMGYYTEVGIGTQKDIRRAVGWYEKAAAHGNTDAADRIAVLAQSSEQALSRQEHDTLTEHKLVRKRTQAKQRSDAVGAGPGATSRPGAAARPNATQVVDLIRKTSQQQAEYHPRQGSLPASAFPNTDRASHPQQQQQAPPAPTPAQQYRDSVTQSNAPARFPERPRYSLVDSPAPSPPLGPSANANAGPRSGSPRIQPKRAPRAGTGGRVPSGTLPPGAQTPPATAAPSTVASPAPGGGGSKYNTFADMGIQGQRASDKDCVIM
ncbi:hypothetical protein DFH11DRAFT_1733825 [Phellopilus nigrolimitatus]|nr:hypothetical protein DFH11DRAFT_1733825 [Phellopilus nigrolimitatus]